MIEAKKLTLSEALVGLNAMLKEANKQPHRAMAFCVVDESGDIICWYRMDGGTKLVNDMAYKKAYTAALHGSNTRDFRDGVRSEGMDLSYFNHPDFTHVPGGQVILHPKITRADEENIKKGTMQKDSVTCSRGQIGGIGASGRISAEDEAIAKIGVEAIQRAIWPEEFK
jgi:uncharacterized protein GlcG (DUF336 family)